MNHVVATIFLLTPSTVSSNELYNIKRMREHFKKEISNAPYIYLQTLSINAQPHAGKMSTEVSHDR